MSQYTYRNGKRVPLYEAQGEFVIREQPEALMPVMTSSALPQSVPQIEPLSPGSSLVKASDEATTERVQEMSSEVATTLPSYYQAETDEAFLITDRIFVTFESATSDAVINEVAARHDLRLVERYSDRDFLYRIVAGKRIDPVEVVVALHEHEPSVETVDHDLNYRVEPQSMRPTDPAYQRQWHLHQLSQEADFDPRSSVNCEEAWDLLGSYGSAEVVIGITDDGCRLDHHDFDSADKFAGWGYFDHLDLITQHAIAADPARMYQSGANHGTACAGVAAGEADAVLTVGAAPGCRLLPIKWESSGRILMTADSKLMTALDYMADKVDIVSNSWGRTPSNIYPAYVLRRIRELVESGGRRGKGILFLWSAGNSNCPIHHSSAQPIPYGNGHDVTGRHWVGVDTTHSFENSLVGIGGVMLVGAIASTAQRSHYSNYGTGLSVCAPSSNSHAYWRMNVRGLGITTAHGQTATLMRDNFGGTSSAAPLVAGIAALVISAAPSLTAKQVVSVLQSTAEKNLNMTGYPRTPPSSNDSDTSWDIAPVAPFDRGEFQDLGDADGTWSAWFGFGRVDARAAVAAALGSGHSGGRLIKASSSPHRPIPDDDPNGLHDAISITESGRLEAIAVMVDIDHDFIGDLELSLVAPGGRRLPLHKRAGANRNNIKQRFDSSNVPQLNELVGVNVAGRWQIHVRDWAAQDTGTLQSWGLELQLT